MDPLKEPSNYKYSVKFSYTAHSSDVRVLKAAVVPEDGLITGSRDTLVKVWVPDGERAFKETHVFVGPTKYIASLCVLPSSTQYPSGLILAGSNDCSIYGFTLDSTEPILRLLGHSDTVCSLSAGKFGTIVSGSWDKTARVWSGQQCVLVLDGHQQAVWATDMFPTQNLILTGSADHTIRLWRSGTCEKVFTGHEDCVRGLAVISDMKFLSCSNDCTVRLWQTSGQCLDVFRSHTDYIYGITLLSNGQDFATCGEDQTIKIWKNGHCVQSLLLASKTLWSVTCLKNGDLAVGSSDGTVYVLGKTPMDSFDILDTEATMSDMSVDQMQGVFGGLSNVPVPDAGNANSQLLRQGFYDGEQLLCYDEESGEIQVFEWNSATAIWKKKKSAKDGCIGDVAFENIDKGFSQMKIKKSQMKKDYEFNVDVEGVMYKLAYNRGENPWTVAQNFVAEHNLLPDHVSQIADYLMKNTAFSETPMPVEYYPAKTYIIYLNVNVVGLRAKLLEFVELVPKEQQVTASAIDTLVLLAYFPEEVNNEQMACLETVINWSDEYLYPALDLLRLAVRCKGICSRVGNQEFVNHLLHILKTTNKSVNRLLVIKIFCNLFEFEEGEKVLLQSQVKIYDSVKSTVCSTDRNVQKSGTALFLNYSVLAFYGKQIDINSYCLNMVEMLNALVDTEAVFRALVAIGTICSCDTVAHEYFRKAFFHIILYKFKEMADSSKLRAVIDLLLEDFK
ncbi:hypothetical protein X975_26927, partial [Stegodyphus mimosarum]